MTPIEKHPYLQWEVSIMEIKENGKSLFKVTRRLAEMAVAETKIFQSKEEAIELFQEWMR